MISFNSEESDNSHGMEQLLQSEFKKPSSIPKCSSFFIPHQTYRSQLQTLNLQLSGIQTSNKHTHIRQSQSTIASSHQTTTLGHNSHHRIQSYEIRPHRLENTIQPTITPATTTTSISPSRNLKMSYKREIASIGANRNPAPYSGVSVDRNTSNERIALQQVEIANQALRLMEEPEQTPGVIEEIRREKSLQGA